MAGETGGVVNYLGRNCPVQHVNGLSAASSEVDVVASPGSNLRIRVMAVRIQQTSGTGTGNLDIESQANGTTSGTVIAQDIQVTDNGIPFITSYPHGLWETADGEDLNFTMTTAHAISYDVWYITYNPSPNTSTSVVGGQ